METDLRKIGPGLGSRSKIWKRVYNKISTSKSSFPFVTSKSDEYYLISQLASEKTWLDFVPKEWINVHSGCYDNYSKSVQLDEKEIMKIEKDVPRTFGLFVRNARFMRLNFPANLSQYIDALHEVLSYTVIDRGYCQGLNFIAASFLLQLADKRNSFILMTFLLKHRKLEILFDPRYSTLLDYMKIFEKRLRKYCPQIYRHFKKHDFGTVSYAIEWFTTCFIVTCPGELSLCIIDLLIAGFDDIMIRVGIGLLQFLQDKLLQLDFEGLHAHFKQLVMYADPCQVMICAFRIPCESHISILEVNSSF
jgi:TBC1 domain family member 10